MSYKEVKELIKKAIIPAAGYGTRSLPITKVLPKEMFPINGKPTIHYIVEEAVEAGIEEILIIVSKYKNLIVDYFDVSLELEAFLESRNKSHLLDKLALPDVHIQYTRQPYARGLGDAVQLGKSFVGEDPFAVLLPDDIILNNGENVIQQLINLYNTKLTPIIALKQVSEDLLHKYGVIDAIPNFGQIHEIQSIVEKPRHSPPSNLAVIGRYLFTSDIFEYINKEKKDDNGEIQLTDAIRRMLQSKTCFGLEVEGDRFDIGVEEDYLNLLQHMHNLTRFKGS
jgi:UTP--glucose-1-phosphate uridylyltransferase